MCVCAPQALERELAPVEERLGRLQTLSSGLTAGSQERSVQERHSELSQLWDRLKVVGRDGASDLSSAIPYHLLLGESRSSQGTVGQCFSPTNVFSRLQ